VPIEGAPPRGVLDRLLAGLAHLFVGWRRQSCGSSGCGCGEMADAGDLKFGRWRLRRASFRFTQDALNPHGYWSKSLILSKLRFNLPPAYHADCGSGSVAKSVAKKTGKRRFTGPSGHEDRQVGPGDTGDRCEHAKNWWGPGSGSQTGMLSTSLCYSSPDGNRQADLEPP